MAERSNRKLVVERNQTRDLSSKAGIGAASTESPFSEYGGKIYEIFSFKILKRIYLPKILKLKRV